MERLIGEWQGEGVTIRYDRSTGVWMFIAIHDRTLGAALGGCRLKVYPEPRDGLREALRLAEFATMRWAAIGLPFGGGIAALAATRPLTAAAREEAMIRFGDLVESLGGAYTTGVDLGTTPADMDVVGRRTSHVFGRSPGHGGVGDVGRYTALGVFSGIRAAAESTFGSADLTERSVLVQGLGAVGMPLARKLARAGARVLITDALPGRVERLASEIGAEALPPEQVYDTPCDIFSPCAIGGVLNVRSIPRLQCRIVAGAASNQLGEEADDERLSERGIVYVPDFVLNAGRAIAHSTIEVLGGSPAQAEAKVRAIGETVARILGDAVRAGVTPPQQAVDDANRVIRQLRERRRLSDYTAPGMPQRKTVTVVSDRPWPLGPARRVADVRRGWGGST